MGANDNKGGEGEGEGEEEEDKVRRSGGNEEEIKRDQGVQDAILAAAAAADEDQTQTTEM